jgi:tRNA threonylcarbamoyladenosine biosynthesis protein TsaB
LRILAFDTSGHRLTAALAEDGKTVLEMDNASEARHSSALVPLLEKLMKKAGWTPDSLDAVAVGIGPGSFTGIRTGVATAKMLALVWEKRLLGVSSLEAAAYVPENIDKARVQVVFDARKGRVYAALFENGVPKIGPLLTTAQAFEEITGEKALLIEKPEISAAALAKAAARQAREKNFKTADTLAPLYLHPKDCNVTKK